MCRATNEAISLHQVLERLHMAVQHADEIKLITATVFPGTPLEVQIKVPIHH